MQLKHKHLMGYFPFDQQNCPYETKHWLIQVFNDILTGVLNGKGRKGAFFALPLNH